MDFREIVKSKKHHYFIFTIDGHSIDVSFKVWDNQMHLESTDKSPSECIKILFRPEEIELKYFYYLVKFDRKHVCPHLSHSDFFKILDVVSNMNGTTNISLEDDSYVKENGFKIPKNLVAMTKRGLTFYNRYGFVSVIPGVDEKYKHAQSKLLGEGASYFGVPDGCTLREAAEHMIQRAKEFKGTEEERRNLQIRIGSFDFRIQEEIHTDMYDKPDEPYDMYHKTAAPYTYRIETIGETFHVIATSTSGGYFKKTKRKLKRKRKTKNTNL
jgi:hypothetical protein